jgi:hypothetical protein
LQDGAGLIGDVTAGAVPQRDSGSTAKLETL